MLTTFLEKLAKFLGLCDPRWSPASPSPPSPPRPPSAAPPAASPTPSLIPRRLHIRDNPNKPVQPGILELDLLLVLVGFALLEEVQRDKVATLCPDVCHSRVCRPLGSRAVEVGRVRQGDGWGGV